MEIRIGVHEGFMQLMLSYYGGRRLHQGPLGQETVRTLELEYVLGTDPKGQPNFETESADGRIRRCLGEPWSVTKRNRQCGFQGKVSDEFYLLTMGLLYVCVMRLFFLQASFRKAGIQQEYSIFY